MRFMPRWLAAAATALLLAACGGDDKSVFPEVTSVSVDRQMYGQTSILTIEGRNLLYLMQVEAEACVSGQWLNSAPYESSDTRAYYSCVPAKVGTQTLYILGLGSGNPVGSTEIDVPEPEVTFTVSDGGSINGQFTIRLLPEQAPITVNNFLRYVDSGFYVNTIFHRLVAGFALQGGGYETPVTADESPEPKETEDPITLEAPDVDAGDIGNVQWSVAMARTNDPDSATSQFFVNLVDNDFLNGTGVSGDEGYAVFGMIDAPGFVATLAQAACTPAVLSECLPVPNLVITAAEQTR